jgi:hypothetical protein
MNHTKGIWGCLSFVRALTGKWSDGVMEQGNNRVMEYWSVEKKDTRPLSGTPIPQYSNSLKLCKFASCHDGSLFITDPSFLLS